MTRYLAALLVIAVLGLTAFTASNSAYAASGTFKGASNHITTGTASIEKRNGGWVLVIGSDFTFDGAPDPKWAFGNNGVDKKTIFTKLKKNKGAQTYRIPASIDPTKYKQVILYCEKFSVPLGVARLR